MRSKEELKRQLAQIDRKGYKAYKVLEGMYDFGSYRLSIDHVQGDPFATPSRVRLLYKNTDNIPGRYFDTKARKIAAEDFLLRSLHKNLRAVTDGSRKGSGKSGLITACRPGQEILERTAVLISPTVIEVRLEVGFPAYGRTIAAGELEDILFTVLPAVAAKTFAMSGVMERSLDKAAALADDQEYIRKELKRQGLIAFVADGSILPRESGISERPMKNALVSYSPISLAVTLNLPHRGKQRGMGIRRGVTVIIGGGYHGKSTLLKAIERGVYNHISGDGREYVITDSTAFKLRAEEGRCVHREDISMFINHLPNKTDTTQFSTENASGSTSQAANTIEALACESQVLLIDEDTSATNFMVRDDLMARVVADEKEPITPFIRRVRKLYEDYGVSTVLVVGSSGAYLSVADTVIQMDSYLINDVTEQAKAIAEAAQKTPDNAEEAAQKTPDSAEDTVRKEPDINGTAQKTSDGTDDPAQKAPGGIDNAAQKTPGGTDNTAQKAPGGIDNAAQGTPDGTDNAAQKASGGIDNAAQKTPDGTDNAAQKASDAEDMMHRPDTASGLSNKEKPFIRPMSSALDYPVRRQRIEKVRVHGWDTLSLDKTEIDLRFLEQLTDETQTAALGYILQYVLEHMADGKKNAATLAREASKKLQKDGLLSMTPPNYGAGAPAVVREQEILAGLARYRRL